MRYFRVFILYINNVLEYRARAFVYFLMSLINPLILIIFWRSINAGLTANDVNSYYLLFIIASGLLIAHIEVEVAIEDIKQGGLTPFLLKPFSYFTLKFMLELAYRLMRSSFSFIAVIIISWGFGIFIQISHDPVVILLSLLIAVFAFILSFVFKMTLALLAFWIEEIRGIFEISDVALIVLAGNIMPIHLYPIWLKNIAFTLPFSYMIYFPIIAIQGKLELFQLVEVIGAQCIWIFILGVLYKLMWISGIKKFTGIGQ